MANQESPKIGIRDIINSLDVLDTKAADFQGEYPWYPYDSTIPPIERQASTQAVTSDSPTYVLPFKLKVHLATNRDTWRAREFGLSTDDYKADESKYTAELKALGNTDIESQKKVVSNVQEHAVTSDKGLTLEEEEEAIRSASHDEPLRERSWADHDEEWQYQPYHLTDREKLALWRRRERILAGEFIVDEKEEEIRDFNDPDYRKKAQEELKRSLIDRVDEMLRSTSSSEVQKPEQSPTPSDGIEEPYQPRPIPRNPSEDQAA